MYTIIASNLSNQKLSFQDILKKSPYTILYFYPKDDTPGCTLEAKDFAQASDELAKKGIQIVGVSKDDNKSHCSFIEKHSLNFSLISDPELKLHKEFGSRGEKNNYGKIIQGVIRSTYLLDQQGTVLQKRHNVRATGHVGRVLKWLQEEFDAKMTN